jgi:hypothetical protein
VLHEAHGRNIGRPIRRDDSGFRRIVPNLAGTANPDLFDDLAAAATGVIPLALTAAPFAIDERHGLIAKSVDARSSLNNQRVGRRSRRRDGAATLTSVHPEQPDVVRQVRRGLAAPEATGI